MHLNPISASFPSLSQNDRTLQVAAGSEAVEVGNVITVSDDSQFRIAKKADIGHRPLFMALQKYTDLQAHMAGFFGVHNRNDNQTSVVPEGTAGEARADILNFTKGPAITGIAMNGREVWETDMFDESKSYAENTKLTIDDSGKWTVAGDNDEALAYCRGRYTRWSNDKVAVPGLMTGTTISVIRLEIA